MGRRSQREPGNEEADAHARNAARQRIPEKDYRLAVESISAPFLKRHAPEGATRRWKEDTGYGGQEQGVREPPSSAGPSPIIDWTRPPDRAQSHRWALLLAAEWTRYDSPFLKGQVEVDRDKPVLVVPPGVTGREHLFEECKRLKQRSTSCGKRWKMSQAKELQYSKQIVTVAAFSTSLDPESDSKSIARVTPSIADPFHCGC